MFQERLHADTVLEILNKQDSAIKYRAEFEDHSKYIETAQSQTYILNQTHV